MQLDWLNALNALDEPCVIVTVALAEGSTPREAGAKMIVTAGALHGTIGGGHLELKAIELARELLGDRTKPSTSFYRFPLGPSLGQCCGGTATLLFERLLPVDFEILLFGAGHVGQALVRVLADLPVHVTWIDGRETQFPTAVPANVSVCCSDEPAMETGIAPPNAYFLVMTHSHALDQSICERILRREDFAYLGLIGSKTKRILFERRLTARGISAERLARMTCPIGIDGVASKEPATIAVAVVAQLLQVRERTARRAVDRRIERV